MKLLLDTHALLWALQDNPRLSARAADKLEEANAEKLVSAVSVYEICLKYRLGKLPKVNVLVEGFEQILVASGCVFLPVTFAHAKEAGLLSVKHKDPFDRLLIAQARIERVPIVSNEKLFDAFGIKRIW